MIQNSNTCPSQSEVTMSEVTEIHIQNPKKLARNCTEKAWLLITNNPCHSLPRGVASLATASPQLKTSRRTAEHPGVQSMRAKHQFPSSCKRSGSSSSKSPKRPNRASLAVFLSSVGTNSPHQNTCEAWLDSVSSRESSSSFWDWCWYISRCKDQDVHLGWASGRFHRATRRCSSSPSCSLGVWSSVTLQYQVSLSAVLIQSRHWRSCWSLQNMLMLSLCHRSFHRKTHSGFL